MRVCEPVLPARAAAPPAARKPAPVATEEGASEPLPAVVLLRIELPRLCLPTTTARCASIASALPLPLPLPLEPLPPDPPPEPEPEPDPEPTTEASLESSPPAARRCRAIAAAASSLDSAPLVPDALPLPLPVENESTPLP